MTLKTALNEYITGLRHIGFVVEDIDKTIAAFSRVYGISADSVDIIPDTIDDDTPARFAFLDIGGQQFELVQLFSDELRATLEANPSGSGGINHVCWQVSDLDACLTILAERGIGPGHVTPDGPFSYKDSRYVYLDPAACDGLLVELVETGESH